ncbi:MAG: hypothetical protein IT381_30845 [Deltaproteobacteria bacterium]|nr:hypothetical protein [Deltaproteobacteria bacterium]
MNEHFHSHANDIDAVERDRITAFCAAEVARGEDWVKLAERVLGELAFYSMQVKSKTGQWSMGELDRFVTESLPSHLGDPTVTRAAPEVITVFARWLKASGQVPSCDVPAIEKRMRKVSGR